MKTKHHFQIVSFDSKGRIRKRPVAVPGIILTVRPLRPNDQVPASIKTLADAAMGKADHMRIRKVNGDIVTVLPVRGHGLQPDLRVM